MRSLAAIMLAALVTVPAAAESFRSDSKRLGNPKIDIVITETERGPRTSVLEVQVNSVGSSVGSSFFIACSLRDLARQRGNYRHIAKVEERPRHGQMLIGFLNSPDEIPEKLDARLAGQQTVDLEQFAPVCDKIK